MFKESLKKTRQNFFGKVSTLLGNTEIDEETWEDIEALLIQADMGVETAVSVVSALRKRVREEGLTTRTQAEDALKQILLSLLPVPEPDSLSSPRLLTVLLIVGVNGSGKTTTIAKLGILYQSAGRKVIFSAADTFRAAAVEQLKKWGDRLNIPVIAGQPGGDPGAVVYDSIRAARSRERDLLIIDTAGRLHTKFNLMEELKKVERVAEKNVHQAPHEVWLVLDGTTGQNALSQAKHFKEAVGVTGVIITKLDSTAKGGMVFAIQNELSLPVRYIGLGEKASDLVLFDREAFVSALFNQES